MKNSDYNSLKQYHFSKDLKKIYRKKHRKCLIFGNFGAMNLGDEAILAGEIQELSKINGIEIVVSSRNPDYTRKLHNIKAVSIYDLPNLTKYILSSDFVIVGGGGIICKADRNILGVLYQIYFLNLYFLAPLFFKKDIYVLGIGAYENSNQIVRKLFMLYLKYAKKITVRDYHTLDLLQKEGLEPKIFRDLSFLMKLQSKSDFLKEGQIKNIYRKIKLNIGLALLNPQDDSEEKYLISQIKSLVSKYKKNATFWFFPCDFQKGFANDQIFAKMIISELKKEFDNVNIYLVPTHWRPQKFFSLFKLMDFIVTLRLHASIFSYRNNIKFLGLTYDIKSSSFLESINKKPIDILDLNINNLLQI